MKKLILFLPLLIVALLCCCSAAQANPNDPACYTANVVDHFNTPSQWSTAQGPNAAGFVGYDQYAYSAGDDAYLSIYGGASLSNYATVWKDFTAPTAVARSGKTGCSGLPVKATPATPVACSISFFYKPLTSAAGYYRLFDQSSNTTYAQQSFSYAAAPSAWSLEHFGTITLPLTSCINTIALQFYLQAQDNGHGVSQPGNLFVDFVTFTWWYN